MQLIQPFPQPELYSLPKAGQEFNLCVAYEDVAAYAQARSIVHQLQDACENETGLAVVFWNFDLLRHEALRKFAASKAATADMVIVSARGTAALPAGVRAWLEGVPPRQETGQAAFVALFDPASAPGREQRDQVTYFRQIACRAGLDFFCNRDEVAAPAVAAWMPHHQPAAFAPHLHPGSLVPSLENWGIND